MLGADSKTWTAERSLLADSATDPHFVVEIESDGTARLRFGDDVNGSRPASDSAVTATYRIGNGTSGNVGADTLVFCSDLNVVTCTNPLPAVGGTDPETPEQIRRRAPQAFMTQERAVTMADYERVAEMNPQVDNSVATLRWTGSWYTVFITAEPKCGGHAQPHAPQGTEEEHQPVPAGRAGPRTGVAAVRVSGDRPDGVRRSGILPQRRRAAR